MAPPNGGVGDPLKVTRHPVDGGDLALHLPQHRPGHFVQVPPEFPNQVLDGGVQTPQRVAVPGQATLGQAVERTNDRIEVAKGVRLLDAVVVRHLDSRGPVAPAAP